MKKIIFSLLKIIFVLVFLFFSVVLLNLIKESKNLPSISLLGEKINEKGIEIYDRTGKIIIYKTGNRRSWVNFEDIPDKIIKATLVAEDIDFYRHKGFSLKGIFRSIYLNLKTKSLNYGGSTITQQLVRNLFLTREKTFLRKMKEIILSLQIEKKYSKNEILTYYLNSIYYGNGNIGIKAAANYYFEKKLKDLTWSEVATLVSIPRAPNLYVPSNKDNLKLLIKRRNYILERLKTYNFISEEEYQQALKEKVEIVSLKKSETIAPHFSLEVINQVKNLLPDIDIENENLKIISTLDYELQKIGEKTVKEGANRNKEKYKGANAALMAIDPKTGEVLALVGSKDFFDNEIDGQVNIPFRLRQPGSAFKPISYATLFEWGYPIETILFDLPTNFGNYSPKNFDKLFKGPINLRQSLAESRNIPAVKVFYLAHPEKVVDLARKIAPYLKDWKEYGLSMALGTAEIKMADLIRFYGALANDGILTSQSLILEVVKDNTVIYSYKPHEERIISQESARKLNDILKDIEARKGLFSASLRYTIFPEYEVAIKTGTTQFYQDAWTFGYTPNIVVGVWAGNTDGKRMSSLGASLVAALPIFHDFLSQAISQGKIEKESFPLPEKQYIDKPMLNGSYISEYGIHNILFYVNRDDPLGPIPKNPYIEPQFNNWERSVIIWAERIQK